VYTCICARVREGEVRAVIAAGAHDVPAVGAACGAGTGCGSCVERICGLIREVAPAAALTGLPAAS
jgi:bacterioferritin-associated ferredoxin